MRACELHFESASQATQVRRQERLIQSIAELEHQRLGQQSAYQDAQKQCKVIENLRDRQLAAWRLDQSRREQRRLDDLFMLRQRRSTDFPRQ